MLFVSRTPNLVYYLVLLPRLKKLKTLQFSWIRRNLSNCFVFRYAYFFHLHKTTPFSKEESKLKYWATCCWPLSDRAAFLLSCFLQSCLSPFTSLLCQSFHMLAHTQVCHICALMPHFSLVTHVSDNWVPSTVLVIFLFVTIWGKPTIIYWK